MPVVTLHLLAELAHISVRTRLMRAYLDPSSLGDTIHAPSKPGNVVELLARGRSIPTQQVDDSVPQVRQLMHEKLTGLLEVKVHAVQLRALLRHTDENHREAELADGICAIIMGADFHHQHGITQGAPDNPSNTVRAFIGRH